MRSQGAVPALAVLDDREGFSFREGKASYSMLFLRDHDLARAATTETSSRGRQVMPRVAA
jgi:hypothetical protein